MTEGLSNGDTDKGSTSNHTQPRTSLLDAWNVLLTPRDYGKFKVVDLFERGYDTWRDENGVRQEDQMLADAQEYVLESVKSPSRESILKDPWVPVENPGRLLVLHTYGTVMIKRNERLQDHTHRIGLHEYLREVFAHHVYAALAHSEHKGKLQLTAGEAVFRRNGQPDQRGPPSGQTVTGIKQMDEFGGGMYYEVPLVHANRSCLVRDEDPVNGEILSRVANNCVYIPTEKFTEQFDDYLMDRRDGVARYFEQALEKMLADSQLEEVAMCSGRVQKKIRMLIEAGQTEKLFIERQYPEKLRCLLKAVAKAPNEKAQLGKFETAKSISKAARWFVNRPPDSSRNDDDDAEVGKQPIKEYEQKIVDKFKNPNSIGKFLQIHGEDHDHIEINRGKYNEYKLQYAPWEGIKSVNISEISDLHELPCLENLHEYLKEEKPLRWVLKTYVRIIYSLKNDFSVDDVVEEFKQYPWFNRETTEYQARYEKNRTMSSGEEPLPISCANENQNFSQFCIGRENCEYSIYRSLPLKQSVSDQTSDSGDDVL